MGQGSLETALYRFVFGAGRRCGCVAYLALAFREIAHRVYVILDVV
jgi:hypothetical protein